jgi:hypothetical protein
MPQETCHKEHAVRKMPREKCREKNAVRNMLEKKHATRINMPQRTGHVKQAVMICHKKHATRNRP